MNKQKIIEKQDEYIKYLLKGILFSNPLRDITKGVRDQFEQELSSLKAEADVSNEDIENMQGAIESIKQITEDTPELNMVNYNHDQVRILNESLIEIYTIVHQFKPTETI